MSSRRAANARRSSARPRAIPAPPLSQPFRGIAEVDVVHPLPAGPRLRRAAPADDHDLRPRTSMSIALDGTFDDAQSAGEGAFREQEAARRILALRRQFDQLGARGSADRLLFYRAPSRSARRTGRSPSRCRPAISATFSPGWIAKKMGLPIERLVIATNANDILVRTLATRAVTRPGRSRPHNRRQWTFRYPRISNGFLFEAYGRDAAAVRRLMSWLAAVRRLFSIDRRAARGDPR